MNASNFMDKQIMDLSRSKSSDLTNNNDLLDLMNPQSEEETNNSIGSSSSLKNNNNDEILPNYDFQPIHRPVIAAAVHSDPAIPTRSFNSVDSKINSSSIKSYNSIHHVEPERTLERAQKVNDSVILTEIDRTMRRYVDSVLHAIDGLNTRLSQMENRTHHLEQSVDELKVSVCNIHGSTDGKMRQLENILIKVQTGVQDLKGKQELMEGHMQLAKLQISKVERPPELPNAVHSDSVQTSASAPHHQSVLSIAPQQVPSLHPNAPSPAQQNSLFSPATIQFPPGHISGLTPPGPLRDAYFSPPNQSQEVPSQQLQMPPPVQTQEVPSQQFQIPLQGQHQQQPLSHAPPPQQYQSTLTPPYSHPPQPPQQQHPAIGGSNAPHISPPFGHRQEEGPFLPSQSYPPNLHQPTSQPSSIPPHSQSYYGSPTSLYEPPSTARSSSGFPSSYVPPSGHGEQYPYGGPASQFGSGSPVKPRPHSPVSSSSNYPQLPTAKILPQSIPTAAGISGGSKSGGSGNRVPIDDVVDKVTSMGFPKDIVRATVRKLTENGQSVDLNIVLDKLMNDGDIQPQGGWFGR